jgi:hypothetical protein
MDGWTKKQVEGRQEKDRKNMQKNKNKKAKKY